MSDLGLWASEFGTSHVLVADQDKSVWDAYVEAGGRPQYIVFDRDMTVVFKGKGSKGHADSKEAVLGLLE